LTSVAIVTGVPSNAARSSRPIAMSSQPSMAGASEQDRPRQGARQHGPHLITVGGVAGDEAAEDRGLFGEFGCHPGAWHSGVIGH
jgi:hypothetical protein